MAECCEGEGLLRNADCPQRSEVSDPLGTSQVHCPQSTPVPVHRPTHQGQP
jgi:hypothetical protein